MLALRPARITSGAALACLAAGVWLAWLSPTYHYDLVGGGAETVLQIIPLASLLLATGESLTLIGATLMLAVLASPPRTWAFALLLAVTILALAVFDIQAMGVNLPNPLASLDLPPRIGIFLPALGIGVAASVLLALGALATSLGARPADPRQPTAERA